MDVGISWRHATAAGQPVLRTMVVCDLADSTALVERLGDRRAAALLRKHDRLTRALIDEHGGREIDKTDGYLLLFERPTQAVAFALAYQRGLRFMSEAEEVDVRARVGIHVGDVVMWENTPEDISRGAKPIEVEGLAKPVAARLSSLARPQQILLSGVAASIARRGHEEIAEDCPEAEWRSHGLYRIRGIAEPLEVYEVGEAGIADFVTPVHRGVARRILPWWRRPSTLTVASLLALIGIGSLLWLLLRQPPTIDFAARDWVVIADVQNQTGQSDYDNTIDTAIRIGLQQSRYVNVIAPAKMSQTLGLMKLDEKTHIDPKIGAEIALRNNARALIVPRVTNAGHGLLIEAQLIDPNTRKVINTVSATAPSYDAVVKAIDNLLVELRTKLGESLPQIKASSVPLEQVTTSNLDALRAYSLAGQARSRGDYHLSLDMLNHAVKLDPGFASAYAMQAANYIVLGRKSLAQKAIDKAFKNANRLSSFERAKLRAQKITNDQPMTAVTAAWKVLADLYPDAPSASNNAGLFYAANMNDCESGLPYLRHAASLPQALRPASTYIMATCELALGHEKSAIDHFKEAYDNGFRGPFLGLADAYVATRQYSKAMAFLEKVPSDSNTSISLAVRQALVTADQGDLASAESNLRHGLQTITQTTIDSSGWALRLDLVGVLWGQGENPQALNEVRHNLNILLSMNADSKDHLSYDYPTLLASFARWAARLGDVPLAERAIRVASSDDQLRGYPIRAQLVAVAKAEVALREGKPEEAVHIAAAADSHPLWELLEVLARAKAAAGDPDAEAAYERALDARPLAFGELYENELGICSRAIQWNLASLDAARFLMKTKPAAASRKASIFLDNWRAAPANLPSIREARRILNPEDASLNSAPAS